MFFSPFFANYYAPFLSPRYLNSFFFVFFLIFWEASYFYILPIKIFLTTYLSFLHKFIFFIILNKQDTLENRNFVYNLYTYIDAWSRNRAKY